METIATTRTVSARLQEGFGLKRRSLHAGVAAEDSQREKLERLCRYISRPAVPIEQLSRLPDGRIRYALKTPYRDGTTHVLFEPLDFLARLAALVPSPGVISPATTASSPRTIDSERRSSLSRRGRGVRHFECCPVNRPLDGSMSGCLPPSDSASLILITYDNV
jgi:hypothetical protein